MKQIARFLSDPRLSFMEVCAVGGVLEAIRLKLYEFAVAWFIGCFILYIVLKHLGKENDEDI